MNGNWRYRQPVEIYFGNGRIAELRQLLGDAERPLLVCDPYFLTNGLSDRVKALAGAAEVFAEISPNPDVGEVNACSRLILEKKIDAIVALGGGSSLDLAKAASIRAETIEAYHSGEKPAPRAHLPVIAVPTTAGTGSEVTCVSVLTDRRTGKKSPIVSESFYPRAALIDPELLYSLPPHVTAATGIDVLCHAVEGYWSRGHQPICDALAVHAIQSVFRYLPVCVERPRDRLARERMAEASVIAGLAFTLPKTTSSHACSFPLTAMYGIPHGEACGLTLDYFIRVNGGDPHTKELIGALGYRDAEAFADAVFSLKKELGLRTGLSDLKLTAEQVAKLVRQSRHPNMENNPVAVTDEMLFELYESLIKG